MNSVIKKIIVLIFAGLLFCGCTVLNVNPVNSNAELNRVAIIKNPDVRVSDFTTVLRKEFEKHGISAEIYQGKSGVPQPDCVVTYTALRSWDIVPYMTYAEITLRKDGKQIGYAEFRLKGNGGLALNKWRGTKAKIGPLMDELLENYPAK